MSTAFCVSVDSQNAAYVYDGTAWTGPVAASEFPQRLTALSCASTTFCMAVDDGGRAVSFDGSRWTAPTTIDGRQAMHSLSCPSSTFCLATDLAGRVLTYSGTGWSTPSTVAASGLGSVSCVSRSFCMAGGGPGSAWLYNGSNWVATALGATQSLARVSCASTTCAAIAVDSSTGHGTAYLYDGTGWSAGTPVTNNNASGLSCVSSTFCVVVDSWGNQSTYDGSSWSAPAAIDTVTLGRGLSCVSSSFCVYVDAAGKSVTLRPSGWASPMPFDPLEVFESVSCPSSTWCLAVDSAGKAFRYDGTTWSQIPDADPGNPLYSISCPSTTFCAAVGHDGHATWFNGSSWTVKQIDPPGIAVADLTSVSCSTPTFCVAVDMAGQAFTFSGSTWSADGGVGVGTPLFSVSCPTTTSCMAGDSSGQVSHYDGFFWGSSRSADPNGPITNLACPTTTFCMATDWGGGATRWNGSSWSAVSRIDPTNDGGPTALACASPTMCLAAVANGSVTRFDGTSWGTLQSVDTAGNLSALACPSAQFCAGLDVAGRALVGTPDTTAPSVQLETAPQPLSASRSASVAFSTADVDDPAGALTVTCRLDGAAPAVCSSPYTTSGLANGTHSVTVLAADPAGNTSAPQKVTWRVDTTAPEIALQSGPSAVSASASASVAFSTADVDDPAGALTVTCRLDGAPPAVCSSPYTTSGLANGAHSVTVLAADPAGNTSAPQTVTWRVDATRPTASLRPLEPFTLGTSVTASWSASSTGSPVASYDLRYQRARYDGGFRAWSYPIGWQHSRTPHQTLSGLAPGYDYCFSVRVRNDAGTTSAWSAVRCTARPLDDRALTAGTGWLRGTGRGFYGSTFTATRSIGRTLTRDGALLDRIALVATTCPSCGTVALYVNGRLLTSVSLASSTTHHEVVINLPAFGYRRATIVLKTVSRHKTVQIDGLGLSRS